MKVVGYDEEYGLCDKLFLEVETKLLPFQKDVDYLLCSSRNNKYVVINRDTDVKVLVLKTSSLFDILCDESDNHTKLMNDNHNTAAEMLANPSIITQEFIDSQDAYILGLLRDISFEEHPHILVLINHFLNTNASNKDRITVLVKLYASIKRSLT